jgi:hypothetical protein
MFNMCLTRHKVPARFTSQIRIKKCVCPVILPGGVARVGEWYSWPIEQSKRCGKINTLNGQKSDFLLSIHFKLLGQLEGN